jgi:hypothetical protein
VTGLGNLEWLPDFIVGKAEFLADFVPSVETAGPAFVESSLFVVLRRFFYDLVQP